LNTPQIYDLDLPGTHVYVAPVTRYPVIPDLRLPITLPVGLPVGFTIFDYPLNVPHGYTYLNRCPTLPTPPLRLDLLATCILHYTVGTLRWNSHSFLPTFDLDLFLDSDPYLVILNTDHALPVGSIDSCAGAPLGYYHLADSPARFPGTARLPTAPLRCGVWVPNPVPLIYGVGWNQIQLLRFDACRD